MNEMDVQSVINALATQRNRALDDAAELAGRIGTLTARNKALEEKLLAAEKACSTPTPENSASSELK